METRVREGRTALAITLLLIATLTVPTALFGGGMFGTADAQQSPSPTGTAPSIELLNPSDYSPTPMISDKDKNPSNDANNDPNDTKYHFNAWVRNAPANATVEFFIVQGNTSVSVGMGQFAGAETFELYSSIPDNFEDLAPPSGAQVTGPTGAATVRAILYGGGSEVDRDEQSVVINQTTETPPANEEVLDQGESRKTNRGETLEILYPANAGGVGFFGRGDAAPSANIEVTSSGGAAEGAGAENIQVMYTNSWPGTDPDWEDCGTESRADSQDGIKCTLNSGDRPEWVTGIAAVTVDTETPTNNPGGVQSEQIDNSGDAHRAIGYRQEPKLVNVDAPAASQSAPGCSGLISALVTDQNQRKIVGAPVDVHAQGPSDNLAFNTDSSEQSQTDSTKPDRNDPPENHAQESGRKCSDASLSGSQGNHAESGAAPDRKHVESTDGTGSDGRFTWRLYSDVAGGTTMTAWVDMDDDDRRCATEISGNGSLTWGSGGPTAPQPPGPEVAVCGASASSASTGTSSASTSSASTSAPASQSSASTSPSNTASRTVSPSVSSSTSTSPASPTSSASTTTGTGGSTTGGTTSSAQQAAVEVTLEASQPRKTFGKSFTLSGSVTSTNPACTDLVNVRILRDVVGGADEFELFAQEQTDANGAFSVTEKADRSANYIAQVTETSACDDASSSPQAVLVRVKVSLTLSKNNVQPGARVRFRIKTAPCPATARDKVLLFRAIQGEFGKSGSARSNQACSATIVRRVNKSAVFQARWPKQSPEFLAGKSRSKAVRVGN